MDTNAARAGAQLPNSALGTLVPRVVHGVLELPVYAMRGGTSTGIVLWEGHLPTDLALREEAIRWIMGVPQRGEVKGNKQTTGLGRGVTTSNKVFIVDRSPSPDADITSTLAQLAADKAAIDWSVNCGNMSAALPMYALDTGLFRAARGRTIIRIYNTNTRVTTDATVRTPEGTPYIPADTEIPGVMGRFPGVELALRNPVGSKTGKLLPTGNLVDRCAGVDVSCVDVAMPMISVRAADVGKTGQETVEELARDTALKQRLREIWVEAGLKMGLKKKDGSLMTADDLANSETVPKVCLVAPPTGEANVTARYFTPQTPHNSLAVTGGCCLAVTCLLPGTVAHSVASGLEALDGAQREIVVAMRNPAGVLRARITAAMNGSNISIPSAAYERSAQIFMRGHFPVYGASAELLAWAKQWQAPR
ncbi:MAG: PrpF domain-containing protein [Rhodospirillaceae bacterium]